MKPQDYEGYLQALEELPKCIVCGSPVPFSLEMRYVSSVTGSRLFRKAKHHHTIMARCEDCWVNDTIRYHGQSQTLNLANSNGIT